MLSLPIVQRREAMTEHEIKVQSQRKQKQKTSKHPFQHRQNLFRPPRLPPRSPRQPLRRIRPSRINRSPILRLGINRHITLRFIHWRHHRVRRQRLQLAASAKATFVRGRTSIVVGLVRRLTRDFAVHGLSVRFGSGEWGFVFLGLAGEFAVH